MPSEMTTFLETEHYTVAQAQITKEDKKQDGYVILNNKTGVREYETSVLPDALMNAAQWDKMMRREFWASYLDEGEDGSGGDSRIIDMMPPEQSH